MAGEKKITEISMKANFAIPGESKFPLAGFFGQPESRNAAEQFRQYFRQLREETCMRMLDIVYNSDGLCIKLICCKIHARNYSAEP